MHKLGEVKIPTIEDFEHVRNLCEKNEDWQFDYEKKNFQVWTKKNDLCKYSVTKIKAKYDDVSAELMYEALSDDLFRPKWDKSLEESVAVCRVSPNSVIMYDKIKFPKPLKKRDFVRQSSWLDMGINKEKVIFSHSVNHAVSRID
jgi:hypothetical protein